LKYISDNISLAPGKSQNGRVLLHKKKKKRKIEKEEVKVKNQIQSLN